MAKLNLSYGAGKLKLGYGDGEAGKLNLGYGSRGKLNLCYSGRQSQPASKAPTAETGKLQLGYSQSKLQLAYKGRTPETGKLDLSYNGKLNFTYGSQPTNSTSSCNAAPRAETGKLQLGYSQSKLQLAYKGRTPDTGKLNLSYNGKLNFTYGSQPTSSTSSRKVQTGKLSLGYSGAKLQLSYRPPQPVQGKLHLSYSSPGKFGLSLCAKEAPLSKEAAQSIPKVAEVAQPAVSNVNKEPVAQAAPPAVSNGNKNGSQEPVPETSFDVSELALSGDGSVENVGVKLDAPIQCADCRQRFVTQEALKIHWRFIHDPNRHIED